MRNWNVEPPEDLGPEESVPSKGRASTVREEIERRYEKRKTVAVLFWIAGIVWFLIVLWLSWQRWRRGTSDILASFGHVLLFGALPAVVLYVVGKWILQHSLSAQEEEEKFHREADFLQYFHRRGRAGFADVRKDFQLSEDAVRGFLIDLAGKRLIRGYIDWKNEEIVSIGEVDIGEECPGCGSPLNYLDPTVGVCDSCGLQVFK